MESSWRFGYDRYFLLNNKSLLEIKGMYVHRRLWPVYAIVMHDIFTLCLVMSLTEEKHLYPSIPLATDFLQMCYLVVIPVWLLLLVIV